MKKHYKRIKAELWFNPYTGTFTQNWSFGYVNAYELRRSYCYRYVRTFNELRQNVGAMCDGHYVRGSRRRKSLPTVWDDVRVSRVYKKSWKDYTKFRKQYMKNL